MKQDKLELLSSLLSDFQDEHTDIDDNAYWSVEEGKSIVNSVAADNKDNQ